MLTFFVISYLCLNLALFIIFNKANVNPWLAIIPGYNFMVWCKLIGRPAGWPFLLLVPIVNIFIFCGMTVDLVRSFGKLRFIDSVLAIIICPIYLIIIGLKNTYNEPILVLERAYSQKLLKAKSNNNQPLLQKLRSKNPYKKSMVREWGESVVFAVFAAAFIRMFLIEAYAIPTSSMEGTLKVGDCLFVSKIHYGLRLPSTVLSLPLLHNKIPVINRKSYFEHLSLDYKRLPALEKIEPLDKIVFNWPYGDSVYVTNERIWNVNQIKQIPSLERAISGLPLITHPVDKREFYVKRCIATPGDTLHIVDRKVFLNGIHLPDPSNTQFKYHLNTPSGILNLKMLERLKVNIEDSRHIPNTYNLSLNQVDQIKVLDPSISLTLLPQNIKGQVFPHDQDHFDNWTIDNYGPVYIPKKGATVSLTHENIALYHRIIALYENNDLSIRDDGIYINHEKVNSYTFQQDYYWGMGDNRHNSEDSRSWGFIPEDHIVGKPLFLHFSMKNGNLKEGINWGRILKNISGKD